MEIAKVNLAVSEDLYKMIKLKDILKESYVWERKFGEPLPTLADVQRKKLAEGKWKMVGKFLTKDGMTTSIPGNYDRDAIAVDIGRDEFKIHMDGNKPYAYGPKYDKTFKNVKDLVKWLNKERAKYAGIDDR